MKNEIVKEDQITSFNDFKNLVESMEVDVQYSMPGSFLYKEISIDKEAQDGYCWSMSRKYGGCVFPMKNSNMVQTFKTISGAKRSLARHCEFIFKNK